MNLNGYANDLNTSYVKVQLSPPVSCLRSPSYLNTSYVKVQSSFYACWAFFAYNLNTSYVKVQFKILIDEMNLNYI